MKIKHTIKQYAAVALLGLLAGSAGSCQDQLQEEVFNFYDVEDYFRNTNMLNMAVSGIYEIFSSQDTYGQSWMVFDTDTDISMVQGIGIGHVARDLGHYNIMSEHSWLETTWAAYFKAIDRANTVMAYKHKVEITDSADSIQFNNLIAQSRCLRGLAYFDLTMLFGDVPLKLTPSKDGDNFNLTRTSRSEIYDQIIADFEESIPYLAESQPGERMTKNAAKGLLARIYLFRGGYSLHNEAGTGVMKRPDNYREYYQKAADLLDEVVASGKHGLLENYQTVFMNMCKEIYDPFENIYEVSFYSLTGTKGGSSTMGAYNGPTIAQGSPYMRANSFIKTHHLFADYFEAGDLRKETAVATFQIDANGVFKEIAKKQSYNWAPGKWRRNWHVTFKDNNNTNVNYVLLRYADILLMQAEIENELNDGPTAKAFECVNQVRRRAFGKPYLTPDASVDFSSADFAGKEEFFNFLYVERARELCFEGMRRMDLIRWNKLGYAIADINEKIENAIAKKEMNEYKFREVAARYKTGTHELYPIPAREIRETSGSMTQNPGYAN